MEVVLAKPQTEKKFDVANPPSSSPHPNFIPPAGYGAFPVAPYGHLTPGYGAAAGFQQVFILSFQELCYLSLSRSLVERDSYCTF